MTQWSALALSAKKSLVNLVRFTMSAITKAKEVVDWVDFIDFWFDVDVAWTRSRMFIFIGSLRDQSRVGEKHFHLASADGKEAETICF